MPTPYTSDTFVIHNELYFAGYTEVLQQQMLDMRATRNGFSFGVRNLKGNLEKASFFESIGSSLITDRDPTDMSPANWNDLTMGETVGVRSYKSAKEKKAIAAFRELGEDPRVMSFVLGQQHAKAVALSYLNDALAAAGAAFRKTPGYTFDATATDAATLTPENLVKMMGTMGDASGRIVSLVMHSQMAHDLLADQVVSQVSTIAGPAIHEGSFSTLGLPVLRTDSPALVDFGDGTGDPVYTVLALTEGAIRVEEDAERDLLTRVDDSAKNLAIQNTLEYSFLTSIRGAQWLGGVYPTSAQLADPDNWEYVYSDPKSSGGVVGLFKSRGAAARTDATG